MRIIEFGCLKLAWRWVTRIENGYTGMTSQERAKQADAITAQERRAKQEAEQRATGLAERLRLLGINPDEI